jgi:hypothetical protein
LIKPDFGFQARSRAIILSTAKKHHRYQIFSLPSWAWIGTFAALFLVMTFATTFFSPQGVSLSLNPEKINREFEDLKINIELQEISYRQDVDQAIASALTEISDNRTQHLNSSILESENDSIDLETNTNPEIDALLGNILL